MRAAVGVLLLVVVGGAVGFVAGSASRSSAEPSGQPSAGTSCSGTAVVRPEDHGAVGDGRADDTPALQESFDRVPEHGTVCLREGATYLHSDVLEVRVAGTVLTGGGALVATDPERSSVQVRADGVTVSGVVFRTEAPRRLTDLPHMKLALLDVTDATVEHTTIEGSAAAGIYVGGTARFVIRDVSIANSRADGLYMTDGSRDGSVTGVAVTNSGDDGISVVTYRDQPLVENVTVTAASVDGQRWGRGMTVVGGRDIVFRDVTIRRSAGAALYFASEGPPNDTRGTSHVVVDGAVIEQANQRADLPQGAVLVYAGNAGEPVADVRVANVVVDAVGDHAGRVLGEICEAERVSGVVYENITIRNTDLRREWSTC
ncbi:right-handed parallel beta-helix repeat-containing protein [Propioniciclava soli]|uniref:right-handed parallel beta-helix repeat-containing protein n=1 Tax=Propioniciclava soli TaxID=2775081 RepID=UPI001E346637